jgi:O-antigen/teichoic acid export membrane protein
VRISGAAVYVVILIIYAITGTASALAVVAALLIGNIVWCLGATRLAWSKPWSLRDRRIARELFRYGIRAHVGNVSVVDGLKLDQLILALFLSTSQLGLYVAAMTVILGNRLIGVSTGMVSFPIACRQDEQNDGETRTQFRRLVGATLVLSVLVAIVEVLLGGRLLALLFGRGFEAGGTALQVLAVGSVFMNMRQVCAEWLRGTGRPGTVAVSEGLAVLSLLLLAVVVWDGSILRVAWMVSMSSLVGFAWVARAFVWPTRRPIRSGARGAEA